MKIKKRHKNAAKANRLILCNLIDEADTNTLQMLQLKINKLWFEIAESEYDSKEWVDEDDFEYRKEEAKDILGELESLLSNTIYTK